MSPAAGVIALLFAIGIQAQPARFDAASIKPSRDDGGTGVLQFTPGRVVGTNVSARQLLMEAYRLKPYQLVGGPQWLDSVRFDIEGKAETAASENQLRPMLQAMLTERFQVEAHIDSKEMPVYALVVARGGLKLREVKEGEPKPPPPPNEPGALMVQYAIFNMQEFADHLSRTGEIGRPVLNKTGLPGVYAFNLQFFQGDDFISVVQERCGLRFESQRALIDILVIDRMQKPAEN